MSVETRDLLRAFEEVDAIYHEHGNINKLITELGIDPKGMKDIGSAYGLTMTPKILLALVPKLVACRDDRDVTRVLLDELPGFLGIAFVTGVVSAERANG